MAGKTRAWCFASGQIEFGHTPPAGAIVIAVSKDEQALRDFIGGNARRGYDGKTLLAPGVPEAPDQSAGVAALESWLDQLAIAKSRPGAVKVI